MVPLTITCWDQYSACSWSLKSYSLQNAGTLMPIWYDRTILSIYLSDCYPGSLNMASIQCQDHAYQAFFFFSFLFLFSHFSLAGDFFFFLHLSFLPPPFLFPGKKTDQVKFWSIQYLKVRVLRLQLSQVLMYPVCQGESLENPVSQGQNFKISSLWWLEIKVHVLSI